MTRINVGIHPQELCDQHLIAEYRELPRCLNAKLGLFDPRRRIPKHFTLGKGHMIWCAQFGFSLQSRFVRLVSEMKYRGFVPKFENPMPAYNDHTWTEGEAEEARVQLIKRITERLLTMKREPIWTRRHYPEWVFAVLMARQHQEKTNEKEKRPATTRGGP